MNILDLLKIAIKKGSSDVHLTVGRCPTARVSGKFIQLSEEILTQEEARGIAVLFCEWSLYEASLFP